MHSEKKAQSSKQDHENSTGKVDSPSSLRGRARGRGDEGSWWSPEPQRGRGEVSDVCRWIRRGQEEGNKNTDGFPLLGWTSAFWLNLTLSLPISLFYPHLHRHFGAGEGKISYASLYDFSTLHPFFFPFHFYLTFHPSPSLTLTARLRGKTYFTPLLYYLSVLSRPILYPSILKLSIHPTSSTLPLFHPHSTTISTCHTFHPHPATFLPSHSATLLAFHFQPTNLPLPPSSYHASPFPCHPSTLDLQPFHP